MILIPGLTEFTETILHYRDARAQFNLGWDYTNGEGVEKDDLKAAYYYKLAADQGYAKAQNNLAIFHEKGRGVEQDSRKAAHYYKLAARKGFLKH